MKNSYLTAGITLKQLIRLLRRNPVSCRPRYLLRILFLIQSAAWSSVFSIVESRRFRKQLMSHEEIPDPVFIIGHWRTGTTFLHKLMSMDPGFIAPTLFHVAVPDSFLTSYRFYKPVMNLMVSRQRPMDMMKMGIEEPQEDEYALYRMTGFSPLNSLIFPKAPGYFLSDCKSFLPEGKKLEEWEKAYKLFQRKLFILSGKRAIFKNPFNSMRIPELRRMFPDARFIHICRNPLQVIPSTRNMFQIVQKQNTLNGFNSNLKLDEICKVYDGFMSKLQSDLRAVPPEQMAEIRFEKMEENPVGCLKEIYKTLRFDFTEEFERRVLDHLKDIKGYRKNKFHLSGEEQKIIEARLKDQMRYYNYV